MPLAAAAPLGAPLGPTQAPTRSVSTTADLDADDFRVLDLLQRHTYDEVRALTGWSRGRIYALALRTGARKTEGRIRERASERRERQAAFLASVLDSTVTADALDFLDGLPANSVALHASSPMYNAAKSYGDCPGADAMHFVAYTGWMTQVLAEQARSLMPGGVLFLQTGWSTDETGAPVPLDVVFFEVLKKLGLRCQNRVIWRVPHGLTPSRRLAGRHETALVFTKGPEHAVFNPTPLRTPQKDPGKRAFKGPRRGQLSGHPYGAFPTDCWDIPNVGHNHPERRELERLTALHGSRDGVHPAPFPVEIGLRAALLYTLPGQLIVDAFCGTGSMQVAARRTGRAFSGCDLFYSDVRAHRLAATAPDLVSHLPGISDEAAALWRAELAGAASGGASPAPRPVWQAEAVPVHAPAAPLGAEAEAQLRLTFC